MTSQLIIRSISTPRLSSYKKFFACPTDESCIPYYRWNQALSSELYILLSTIEICLRNKIHIALSEEVSVKFNKDQPISSNFCWYDYFNFIEVDKHGNKKTDRKGQFIYTETGNAFRKITHKRDKNLGLLPQIVISKLEFGKWSYVLSAKKYENGDLIDWNTLFPLIFPHFIDIKPNKHQIIIERIKDVKNWRNRLAHLEPVWKFSDVKHRITGKVLVKEPTNKQEIIQRLNKEVRKSMDLLLWLCLETHDHYKLTDSYKNLIFLISDKGLTKFTA